LDAAFPDISRKIAEGLGRVFIPAVSAVVPIAGSLRFLQGLRDHRKIKGKMKGTGG